MRESEGSLFGDYGIEECTVVPEHEGTFYVADTLRALLDILQFGPIELAQGMKEDFICNDRYTGEFLRNVIRLRGMANWDKIDELMSKEYLFEWDRFKVVHDGRS